MARAARRPFNGSHSAGLECVSEKKMEEKMENSLETGSRPSTQDTRVLRARARALGLLLLKIRRRINGTTAPAAISSVVINRRRDLTGRSDDSSNAKNASRRARGVIDREDPVRSERTFPAAQGRRRRSVSLPRIMQRFRISEASGQC